MARKWPSNGAMKKIQVATLYIKQIDVEPPARLTAVRGSEFSPAWSPDGQLIAFVRAEQPAIVVVPQRGGRERILTPHLGKKKICWAGPTRALTQRSMTKSAFTTAVPVSVGFSSWRSSAMLKSRK
jgi:Tol biopolymer transport system component